jgi:hypothetical protein
VSAQACPPNFRIAATVGPAGAIVLGAWDFDRDGRTDLLLRADGEVRVARNAGGSFLLGPPISTGGVAVGDFDGDGILDVVAVQFAGSTSTVYVLKGDGHAGFALMSSLPASASLSGSVTGDFDGDGKLDLAVSAGGSDVWLYRGDGHGGFGLPYVLHTSLSVVSRLATLDVDASGRVDLLVSGSAGFGYNVLSTYTLGSAGIFVATNGPDGGGNQCPFDLATGDVDGDGRPDAVTVERYVGGCPNEIRTFLVRSGTTVQLRQPATSLWSPVLADFDGDGHNDLAAVRGSLYGVPTGLAVQLGDGAGGFGPEAVFAVPDNVNRETAILTAADLDGDGRPDLVLSGIPSLPPLVFRNVCGNPHEIAAPGPAVPVRPRTRPAP